MCNTCDAPTRTGELGAATHTPQLNTHGVPATICKTWAFRGKLDPPLAISAHLGPPLTISVYGNPKIDRRLQRFGHFGSNMLTLRGVFEGTIAFVCISTVDGDTSCDADWDF